MEKWKVKLDERVALCEMLLRYDWHWSCSLPLSWHNVPKTASMKVNSVDLATVFTSYSLRKNTADYSTAEEYLKKWRKMAYKDKIVIAYMAVFNPIPFPHVHLFLWGKEDNHGQTLLDRNHNKWESEWYRLTGCRAKITPIYSRGVIDKYVADKNMKWDGCELLIPYPNKKLLQKALIKDPEIISCNKFLLNKLFEKEFSLVNRSRGEH